MNTSVKTALAALLTVLILGSLALAVWTPVGRYWSGYMGLSSGLNLAHRAPQPAEAIFTFRTWQMDSGVEKYVMDVATQLAEHSAEFQRLQSEVLENVRSFLPETEALASEPTSTLPKALAEILQATFNAYLEVYMLDQAALSSVLSKAFLKDMSSLAEVLPFAGLVELQNGLPRLSAMGLLRLPQTLKENPEMLLKQLENLSPEKREMLTELLSEVELETVFFNGAPFIRIEHKATGLSVYAHLPDRRHIALGSDPKRILKLVEKVRSSAILPASGSTGEVFVNLQALLEKIPLLRLLGLDAKSVSIKIEQTSRTSLTLRLEGGSIEFLKSYEPRAQKFLSKYQGEYEVSQEEGGTTVRAEFPFSATARIFAQEQLGEIQRRQAFLQQLSEIQEAVSQENRVAAAFSGDDVDVLLKKADGAGDLFLRAGLGDPKTSYEMTAHISKPQKSSILVFSGHCTKALSQLQVWQAGKSAGFVSKGEAEKTIQVTVGQAPSQGYVLDLDTPLKQGEVDLIWTVSKDVQDVGAADCHMDFPPFVL